MDAKPQVRFTLGKQSSMAPDRGLDSDSDDDRLEAIDPRVRLMFFASEGDLEGIKKLLSSGTDVNFKDIDNRTALHVAACQGFSDVAQLLLEAGADVDPQDKWGSTPLADAIHYKNHGVAKLLEKHGAKHLVAPMHVNNAREIPEYEIDAKELDFTNSIDITTGTFSRALWRGTQVAVKKLGDELCTDEDKVAAFRDELELLQKIRHPNVVQFLGAVTQSSPMMIVIEFLPKGDLKAFLKKKGALKPLTALKYAMDIARDLGLEYVDLYLIHMPLKINQDEVKFPIPTQYIAAINIKDVWEAMERCQNLGLTKSIGVSNFYPRLIEEIFSFAKIPPVVNQLIFKSLSTNIIVSKTVFVISSLWFLKVEMNPFWQQKKLNEFCKKNDILLTGYSPKVN